MAITRLGSIGHGTRRTGSFAGKAFVFVATPGQPQRPDIGSGGAAGGTLNQWGARRDRLRREMTMEEEELLAVAQIAVQQLAIDHMQRQAM